MVTRWLASTYEAARLRNLADGLRRGAALAETQRLIDAQLGRMAQ
jgi:hypothetical protein